MRLLVVPGCLVLFVAACATTASTTGQGEATAGEDLASADASSAADGPPAHGACVSTFGSGLSGSGGRLDGVVVAVVPQGAHQCHGDGTHVHVQVLSQGSVYDVAVNTDGGFIAEKDLPLPGGAWSGGWHAGKSLSYVTDLGLHSADFQTGSLAQISQDLETALASANHVSVFGIPYSHGGMHLIHKSKSNGTDGAIITDPLAANAKIFAFHFASQTF